MISERCYVHTFVPIICFKNVSIISLFICIIHLPWIGVETVSGFGLSGLTGIWGQDGLLVVLGPSRVRAAPGNLPL